MNTFKTLTDDRLCQALTVDQGLRLPAKVVERTREQIRREGRRGRRDWSFGAGVRRRPLAWLAVGLVTILAMAGAIVVGTRPARITSYAGVFEPTGSMDTAR